MFQEPAPTKRSDSTDHHIADDLFEGLFSWESFLVPIIV